MKTRISHSAVRLYSQCSKRYQYHYIERLRSPVISGALLFGSAIDAALNDLLLNKSVEQSKKIFNETFEYQAINNVRTHLPTATNVVYAKNDFDAELIPPGTMFVYKTQEEMQQAYDEILERKQKEGFDNLNEQSKKIYNQLNWMSMLRKGHVMIETYAEEILPQVREVLAVQKNISLKNNEGDEIIGVVDLIVEWKDGKRYILDNKTSTREYEADSAMRSQQLLLYHHICKEEYKIDGGVGFIVLYKQLAKNRKKICSVCGFDGSGARHKTCPKEYCQAGTLEKTERCNGEWKETIDPKARIEVILNQAPEAAEDLVLLAFDSANEGIKKEVFAPNLQACGSGDWICPFYKKCWFGKDDGLIKLEEKKK